MVFSRILGIRKEIGHRTIFNKVGPLTNPANPQTMLIGAYSVNAAKDIAYVVKELGGVKRAMVVHGQDGLDEISLYELTTVFDVEDSEEIKEYTIYPDYTPYSTQISLKVDSAEESASICRKILHNKRLSQREDAMKRAVIPNVAMAMYVNDLVGSRGEGTCLAQESIESGAAKQKLEELIKLINSF